MAAIVFIMVGVFLVMHARGGAHGAKITAPRLYTM